MRPAASWKISAYQNYTWILTLVIFFVPSSFYYYSYMTLFANSSLLFFEVYITDRWDSNINICCTKHAEASMPSCLFPPYIDPNDTIYVNNRLIALEDLSIHSVQGSMPIHQVRTISSGVPLRKGNIDQLTTYIQPYRWMLLVERLSNDST